MTPKATSSATDPSVLLKPLSNAWGMSATGIPAAMAVRTLMRTSDTNACSLTFMMRKSRAATAAAAISRRTPTP